MLTLQEIISQESFSNLELLASQVVEGFITGLHKSPYHGFSVEFVEHRIYNVGESKKHVDWKLYAKTDKLFVKKYEEETNLRCQILIDTSSSMYFPNSKFNKLKFSIWSAAAIIHLLKKQRDASGISLFSDQIDWHTKSKQTISHQKMLFSELEKLLHQKIELKKASTNTAQILHHLAEQIHQRSLIILFSDMFSQDQPDELFSALQHFRFKKHELIVFHVTDPSKEKELEFNNRPHRFVDLETGEAIKINPSHIREHYKTQMQQYYENLKLKCSQYKIDFVEVDINKPFADVLTTFLIKRQRLY
jgi:uncharacterized protein (DUF58 family)